jgi:homoserine kinase
VLGVVLSGAGPSILVITSDSNIDKIKDVINMTWQKYSVKAELTTFALDAQGATILTK